MFLVLLFLLSLLLLPASGRALLSRLDPNSRVGGCGGATPLGEYSPFTIKHRFHLPACSLPWSRENWIPDDLHCLQLKSEINEKLFTRVVINCTSTFFLVADFLFRNSSTQDFLQGIANYDANSRDRLGFSDLDNDIRSITDRSTEHEEEIQGEVAVHLFARIFTYTVNSSSSSSPSSCFQPEIEITSLKGKAEQHYVWHHGSTSSFGFETPKLVLRFEDQDGLELLQFPVQLQVDRVGSSVWLGAFWGPLLVLLVLASFVAQCFIEVPNRDSRLGYNPASGGPGILAGPCDIL